MFFYIAFILQESDQDQFFLFNTIFSIVMGDASSYNSLESNIPWLFWIIYLVATIFFTIIMLNLLISIIGDSYDKVIGVEERSRYHSLLLLVLQYEKGYKDKYDDCFLVIMGPRSCFEDLGENNQLLNGDGYGMNRIREKIENIEIFLKRKLNEIPLQIENKMKTELKQQSQQYHQIEKKIDELALNLKIKGAFKREEKKQIYKITTQQKENKN